MFGLVSETLEQHSENESVGVVILTLYGELLDWSAIPQLYDTVIHGNMDANPCVKETSMSSVPYSEHRKYPSSLEIVT